MSTRKRDNGKRDHAAFERDREKDPAEAPLDDFWPGAPPEDQKAVWAAMSQAHRRLAARRLDMIRSYEAGGSRDAAAHVDVGELSLPRFHAVLGAWRRERSLHALVPQARRRATRAFAPPSGIEEEVARAVRAGDGRSRERIAVEIHERHGRPSLSWIRRLVASTTRDIEREVAGGSSGFGRRIVVDSSALPLPLLPHADGTLSLAIEDAADADGPAEREDFEWAVAAFAWDAATGRVLGHAVSRAPATMTLHAFAAAVAADALRAMDAPGRNGSVPEVATTLPLEDRDAMETMRLMIRLRKAGAEVIHSSRTAGAELMKAFSGRLGTLDLRPRFAGESFAGRTSRQDALARSGRSPMRLDEAELVVRHAVAMSNDAHAAPNGDEAVGLSIAADRLDAVFLPYLTTWPTG